MAVLTTESIRLAVMAESHYAAGKGAAVGAKTPLGAGDVASVKVMNFPAEEIAPALPQANRERKKPIGTSKLYRLTLNKSMKYIDLEYKQYVQANDINFLSYFDDQTTGAVPTSFLIHMEIAGVDGAMDYFDIVGAVPVKYNLKASGDDFPIETITFKYYDIVDSVAVTNLAIVNQTHPKIHKDIVVTVDSDTVECDSVDFTIETTVRDKPVCGSLLRCMPYVVSQDLSLEIEFDDDAAAIVGDCLARNAALTAVNLIGATVANGLLTCTMTNMAVNEDDIGKVPAETDFIGHKLKLENSGNSALTIA